MQASPTLTKKKKRQRDSDEPLGYSNKKEVKRIKRKKSTTAPRVETDSDSAIEVETSLLEHDFSTNPKGRYKSYNHRHVSEVMDTNMESTPEHSMDEGNGGMISVMTPNQNKGKERKGSSPELIIDPQLLYESATHITPFRNIISPPGPKSARRMAPHEDDPMIALAALPFNTMDSIDPATFGLGPNSSSDDILRVIKNMDLSALTTAKASSSASVIPARKPGPISKPKARQRPVPLVAPPIINETDHERLLSTKWMNTATLAQLGKTQGLQYKKGKFSATEASAIKTALLTFGNEHNLNEEQVIEVMFTKRAQIKEEHKNFWHDLATAVPLRPLIAVYNYCKRAFHPLREQGKWTPEEDQLILEAVTDLGQAWEKVGERVGRMPQDCRDRYRNHLLNRDKRVKGAWTKEEEELLTEIIRDVSAEQGRDPDSEVFWGVVSARMGGTRSRAQIRIKWLDSLNMSVKANGAKVRWRPVDSYILIHKVATMDVSDDTEIDWKLLSDPDWNFWSAHTLQRRWFHMKRAVKGHEDMPFYELVDILKAKKGSSLPGEDVTTLLETWNEYTPHTRPLPISAAMIEETDEEDMSPLE